ncbi:MAG: bifunctional 3-deoxy-7-phosphoheptulonate synthase/chorismate mutase type II [Muribaculaceae bacterium]|nr:bifunctional 3-deoxy-7-phosphoheptulonate synthase/chorismate mutase type II [Muribaculaceae bacterium]
MDISSLLPLFGATPHASRPLIIAGPCSVESPRQISEVAQALSLEGIKYLRAGIWKPRTHPGSFEGVGARGLKWLVSAAVANDMIPLTEVANASHLRSALRAGIKNFWIGARTAANPFAVQELADEFALLNPSLRESVTVLVKNPVNPDIELWIGSIQRLYSAGIRRLGAIHRGFSSYGEKTFRNRPEWRIPIELKRRIPELPVICDPSHIAGRRGLVEEVARQAMEMDFDGLIIEAHCFPDDALSDREQQLTPSALGHLIKSLGHRCNDSGATSCLKACRDEIDGIDREIIALLSRRMDVAREIGEMKRRESIPVVQPDRYKALMEERIDDAARLNLSPEFLRRIFSIIHDESVNQQLS